MPTPQLNVLKRVGGSIGTADPGGRAAARDGRRPLAQRGCGRLRLCLLVGARDDGAGDDPVLPADAG